MCLRGIDATNGEQKLKVGMAARFPSKAGWASELSEAEAVYLDGKYTTLWAIRTPPYEVGTG